MIELDKMRYAEYTGMPAVVEPIANDLGIELSDDAQTSQMLIAGIAANLDDIIDRGTLEERNLALSYWEHLATGAELPERPEGKVLPQLIADLDALHRFVTPNQAQELYALGRETISLSEQYSTASDVDEYYALRSKEARIAFKMMVCAVPEQERAHPKFQQYIELAETAGAIAASLDNIKDLRGDATEGRTGVNPTMRAHLKLSRLALHDTVEGVRTLGVGTTSRMLSEAVSHSIWVEKLHYLHGVRHPQDTKASAWGAFYNWGVESTIEGLHRLSDLRHHGIGWIEDQMTQLTIPAENYPGDEAIPIPYADVMQYDPKEREFPHLAIRSVLASAYAAGAEITPQIFEDVKRMAMGPEATDPYLDDCGSDPAERERRHLVVIGAVQDIVAGVPDSENLQALQTEAPLVYGGLLYYGRALHTMPDAARLRIGWHANQMLHASLAKSQTTDVHEYTKLVYQEAAHYGHIWACTVWARQNPEKEHIYRHYDAWISDFLGGMLLVSAGLDLRKDHRNGEISFTPRPFARVQADLVARGMGRVQDVIKGYRQLRRLKREAQTGL